MIAGAQELVHMPSGNLVDLVAVQGDKSAGDAVLKINPLTEVCFCFDCCDCDPLYRTCHTELIREFATDFGQHILSLLAISSQHQRMVSYRSNRCRVTARCNVKLKQNWNNFSADDGNWNGINCGCRKVAELNALTSGGESSPFKATRLYNIPSLWGVLLFVM